MNATRTTDVQRLLMTSDLAPDDDPTDPLPSDPEFGGTLALFMKLSGNEAWDAMPHVLFALRAIIM